MNFENDFSSTAGATREKISQSLTAARASTEDAVSRGEQYVREKPRTAMLSVFVAGVAVGAIVALAARPAPRRPTLTESLSGSLGDSKERFAEFVGAVASQLRGPLQKKVSSVSDRASNLLSEAMSDALDKVPSKLRWW